MKEYKMLTSNGVINVSDVTCLKNAVECVKSQNDNIEIYEAIEVDDYGNELERCILEPLEENKVKYRKKKPSSVSKSSAKSNHKHTYTEIVIFKYKRKAINWHTFYEAWSMCSHCGKLGKALKENHYINEKGYFKSRTLEELQSLFPNAEVVDVGENIPFFDFKYLVE